MKIGHYLLFLCMVFLVGSCEESTGEKSFFSPGQRAAEAEKLAYFLEREFQEDLRTSPMLQARLGIKWDYGKWGDFSSQRYTEKLNQAKQRLAYLEDSINAQALTAEAALSFRLYKQQMEQVVEDYKFRFYNYPVNQVNGLQTEIPSFLINFHLIDSVADARAYISRLNKLPRVMEEVIEGLKLREVNGIIPPKFVYQDVIDVSRNIITGKPFEKSTEESILLADFKQKLSGLNLPGELESELLMEVQSVLVNAVGPAYEKLIAFLEDQRQRALAEHGVWRLPKGKEFYSDALEEYAMPGLGALEIHQFGLNEVARIHKEMEETIGQTGFEGSLGNFFEKMRTDPQFYFEDSPEGRANYLREVRSVIESVDDRIGDLFFDVQQEELMVKAVEPFREKSAGKAFYTPAVPDARPGIYYANLSDMSAMPTYQMEALLFHEGIPGHHFQRMTAMDNDSLPMFRQLSNYPAYNEGWGMYSQRIPKKIGFYADPYSDFGRLTMELIHAIGLVADTGIHSKEWTRQAAIDYYTANSPISELEATRLVERIIIMPGEATSYKIGMNKILELREIARDQLGEDFGIREFHQAVLQNAQVPLNVLEDLIYQWIDKE